MPLRGVRRTCNGLATVLVLRSRIPWHPSWWMRLQVTNCLLFISFAGSGGGRPFGVGYE